MEGPLLFPGAGLLFLGTGDLRSHGSGSAGLGGHGPSTGSLGHLGSSDGGLGGRGEKEAWRSTIAGCGVDPLLLRLPLTSPPPDLCGG